MRTARWRSRDLPDTTSSDSPPCAVEAPSSGAMSGAEAPYRSRGRDELKSAEEIMELLNAYDLTGSYRDAGELAGCSHHMVKRYVERRAVGGSPSVQPLQSGQRWSPAHRRRPVHPVGDRGRRLLRCRTCGGLPAGRL